MSAAPPDDACLFLTQAQLTSVLGVAVGAGTHTTPEYVKTCTWALPGDSARRVQYLTLSFQLGPRYAVAKRTMDQMMPRLKVKSSVTAASGIGDDAYYTVMASSYTALNVAKGSVAFKVAMYGDFPTNKVEAMEKTLALQVLSKL
ncbi:MAG: hypothetical protein WBQ26_05300 [Gemmatimonadaceae bacterium]|nr:hypothetical protein [Gemmatimonadaceae bacterium]